MQLVLEEINGLDLSLTDISDYDQFEQSVDLSFTDISMDVRVCNFCYFDLSLKGVSTYE